MTARNRKAIPCPGEGCDGSLVPMMITDEVEGYCGSCQKLYPWPLVDDEEGSAKAHQLGPLAATERRQERPDGQLSPAAPVLVTVADVEREEVSWLWPGYIPKGRLTIIDGDPGVGKSWLTLAIAAAVTTGAPWPGQVESREAANVLVLTAEDGIADTVRPRLEDMGADLRRVRVLTGVQDGEGHQRHASLVDDLPVLDGVLAQGGYGLVIIDPLNAYLGTSLDTHRDAALRAVLTPLAQLAERWGVAVVCIRHLTKSPRDRAIYRGQGSIAYTAAARVVHLVGVNPDDPTERVMTCIKNNLAPEPPSLAFELTDGRFLWRGETSVSAAALLRPDADDGERGALTEAEDFLRELLADGPVEAKRVEQERREAGIAPRTLDRAKAALGVKSERQGGLAGEGRWVWALSKIVTPTSMGSVASLDGPDTKGKAAEDDLGDLREAAPAAPTPAPADDSCRKLALDLWEATGRRPIRWKLGETIFDLRLWLRRAAADEVARVVELLEAMPAPKGGSE